MIYSRQVLQITARRNKLQRKFLVYFRYALDLVLKLIIAQTHHMVNAKRDWFIDNVEIIIKFKLPRNPAKQIRDYLRNTKKPRSLYVRNYK